MDADGQNLLDRVETALARFHFERLQVRGGELLDPLVFNGSVQNIAQTGNRQIDRAGLGSLGLPEGDEFVNHRPVDLVQADAAKVPFPSIQVGALRLQG